MNLRTVTFGLLLLAAFSCQSEKKEGKTLFEMVSPKHSGVRFNNLIPDNDSFNILSYEYIYNGGGVAIADFDNDGLSDLFFSGNIADNKLYPPGAGRKPARVRWFRQPVWDAA